MCKESLSWGGLKQNNEQDFRQIREKRIKGNFKIRDTTFSNSRIRKFNDEQNDQNNNNNKRDNRNKYSAKHTQNCVFMIIILLIDITHFKFVYQSEGRTGDILLGLNPYDDLLTTKSI